MPRIILLIGPKGSGKSTIGDLLEREEGVRFLRVEPIFLLARTELGPGHPDFEQQGFAAVLARVAQELPMHASICIESTGASTRFPWFLEELGRLADVILVQIRTGLPQCLDRVRSRDRSIHIPVSDDQVDRINARAAEVRLPWAAVIDNSGPFDPGRILSVVRDLLARPTPG